MFEAALKTVHLLTIIVWVGGMAFAHFCLRPAAAQLLEPPQRLRLLHGVLGRFFAIVSVASLLAIISGVALVGRAVQNVQATGGVFQMPPSWHVMSLLGLVMLLIFLVIRWVFFRQLHRAVMAQDWPAAGAAMGRIRPWVLVNLVLGTVVIVTAGLRLGS